MTDHIADTGKKVIDLDALEKLADEASAPMPGRKRLSWFRRQTAFKDAADPATIKALIAELKEARGFLSRVATDAFACQEDSCLVDHRIIADVRAFLARNGKGEG